MRTEGAKENKRPQRNPWWGRWLLWPSLFLFGFILLIVAAWAGLQTRWAKDRLSVWIAAATQGSDGFQVTLGRLDGRLPFSISADRVTLSDKKGNWLEAQQVDISIRPAALLSGMLELRWLRVKDLSVLRLPEARAMDRSKAPPPREPPPLSLPRVVASEIVVDRIYLAEAIAGTPMAYRLQSNAETRDSRITVHTLLKDLDHRDDPLRLEAVYDLTTEHVEANLTYDESEGGPAARLFGLTNSTGIRLQITANGLLANLKGRLDLDLGGYGRAGLDVAAGLSGNSISFSVDGRLGPDPSLIPKNLAASLGGLEIDVQCQAHVSSDGMIHVRSLKAKAPSAHISLQGTADPTRGLMNLEAAMSPLDLSPFLRDGGLAMKGLGPIHIAAQGDFNRPEVALSTSLNQVSSAEASLKDIKLTASGAFETGYTGLRSATVSIAAKETTITEMPNIGGPLRLNLTASSPDYTDWRVEGLQLTAPQLVLSSPAARVNAADGGVSGNFLIQFPRIAALLPEGARGVDGQAVLRARAEGNITARQVQVDLDMDLTRLSGLPRMVEGFVGPSLTVKATGCLLDQAITLEEAIISGRHGRLSAEGRMNLATASFQGQYRLSLPDLAPTGDDFQTKVSGHAESSGRLTGSLRDMAADLVLTADELRVNDLDLRDIHTHLQITDLPGRPTGSLDMKGVALNQPFHIIAGVAWSGEILTLSQARANLPGIDIGADLGIRPRDQDLSGSADVRITSLKLMKALLGVDLAGTGHVQIKAGKSAEIRGLTLNADFKGLHYDRHAIADLRIYGRMDDMRVLRGDLRLEAKNALFDHIRLKTFRAGLVGSLDRAVATMEAKGSVDGMSLDDDPSDAPVSLSAGIQATHDHAWRFRMDRFDFLFGKTTVALAQPAVATLHDQEITLDDLQLSVATGLLQVKGRLGGHAIHASVRIAELPMTIFSPWIGQAATGIISTECAVSGPLTDPAVHAEMRLRDYRVPLGEGRPDLQLEAELNADRKGNRFEARLVLRGLDETPFSGTASLPARFSIKPFILDLDRDGDLNGRLKGHLNLAALNRLPGMENQTVLGDLDVDMGVSGSVDAWALKGGIDIRAGRYENPASGTILSEINGRLLAEGRNLRWDPLAATDGEVGRITLEGGLSLMPPFPIDAALSLHQATLLRKDILTSTASGRLDIKGTPEKLGLSGQMVLDRTELEIPKRLPPDVVVIPVKEINRPPGEGVVKGAHPSEDSKRLATDLSIKIPSRFFVRGRGLDAEFKGELAARGPANKPVIRGTLNVVRGTFQFLSRTFHITQGQIAFDGGTPPVPFLNVTAQVSAGQIEAQVRVTGPADDFKLTLSSQPPLPQEEIMANILFGQSVAKLNPFQAYQLAASISQLSGGGMPDIVGKTRGLLGVDRLSISGGDNSKKSERGPALSAGKYVSEGVYVGVEQELTDARQDVVVEVEVTPHFSVESRAGTRSGAGVGLNWKYDY